MKHEVNITITVCSFHVAMVIHGGGCGGCDGGGGDGGGGSGGGGGGSHTGSLRVGCSFSSFMAALTASVLG